MADLTLRMIRSGIMWWNKILYRLNVVISENTLLENVCGVYMNNQLTLKMVAPMELVPEMLSSK